MENNKFELKSVNVEEQDENILSNISLSVKQGSMHVILSMDHVELKNMLKLFSGKHG